MTKEERLELLNYAFSPTAPIKEEAFFYGRISQLEKICEAINEDGQHAILFGERGVGKTSLANIMSKSLTNIYPIKVTCNRGDNFRSLWKQAFQNVQFSTTTAGIGFTPTQKTSINNLSNLLDEKSTTFSSDLMRELNKLTGLKMLFIFDEYDNIIDKDVRKLFADLIKSFSDNNTNTTIVLVGIADDVDTLIGNHLSLERCLKQVKMPRMSEKESDDIIDNGLARLQITVDNVTKAKIVEFASGFPHYVHLLCKYGCLDIIQNDGHLFTQESLDIATHKGIENTNEQLKSAYRKAIIGLSTTNKWKDVLFACTQSQLDEFNCFSITDILTEYAKITNKSLKGNSIAYNLNQLCYKERGMILQKIDTGKKTRYRFSNPMMRAYLKLMINTN